MKLFLVSSVLVASGVVLACASDAEQPHVPPSTGGTSGTAGSTGAAGAGGTAGTSGAGGSAGTGGSSGTGGSAGTSGSGGVATGGAAGASASGGTSGSAGMAGSSGSAGMGGMSGSTGETGGMGGMSGGGAGNMGGMSGTDGSGGAGMAGTGGTGPVVPTVEELTGALDGHLIITPCGDTPNQDDCLGGGWRSSAVDNGANHSCNQGQLEANITIPIGGEDGVEYDVTMHFYGVMEPRRYANVMREAGDAATDRNGGTPTGWAEAPGGTNINNLGDQNYNTYEMHVYDHMDQAVRSYFMNSDNNTGHYTLITNYEKTITLIGGGEVRLRVFDANCRMIKNCGASGGAPCGGKARTVNIADAMPQPSNPMLMQPGLGQAADHAGQWWLIDVKNVALAN
jgi:hypothetical protein